MKILKSILFISLLSLLFIPNSHAWTLNQTLTGLDGQTITAGNNAYSDINLSTNGYHLLVIHVKGSSFGANFTIATVTVLASADNGSTISDRSVWAGNISNLATCKGVVIKISQYPYIRIKVTNDTTPSTDDGITLFAKYAIY